MKPTGLMCMLALAWMAAPAGAAELAVGPGKPFARIEDALAKAQAGDTILVHPLADNKPYEKVALFVTKPRIAIRAVAPGGAGQRVKLSGDGFDYSGAGSVPRAIVQFNRGADGCVLEGFELSGAHNESFNGAGVRINQANDVAVRGCHIHDNDMGIMSNGDGTESRGANQLIESCLIESNGNAKHPGYNHNLYLGGTSVTLSACEVRASLTGHNIKSRAHRTLVLNCYVHDSANRELDLVDAEGDTTRPGSDAAVVGNVIVKNPRCEGNRGVIHFGQDGGREHDGTLWLAQNTIVTPFIAPVVTLSAPKAKAQLLNNIVWDAGSGQNGQVLAESARGIPLKQAVGGQCNWLSSGFSASAAALGLPRTTVAARGNNPPFAAPEKGDLHFSRPDPTITDAGQPLPPELMQLLGGKLYQYHPPLSRAPRPAAGKPDLGAFELTPPGNPEKPRR